MHTDMFVRDGLIGELSLCNRGGMAQEVEQDTEPLTATTELVGTSYQCMNVMNVKRLEWTVD